jgi:ribosomal protein L14E/L6E/L27E
LLTTRRKSQLAIEYCYQVRSKSPATWAFWVHASNEARFEQSFRDLADQVKIPGRQDPNNNIFKLVEIWLRDEKTGKWVCILDNIDDDRLLCSVPVASKGDPTRGPTNASTKPLLGYVPRSRNGSVIITSRTREAALKIVDHKGLIEVKPLERSEALELLQRRLEQPMESQESQQLVNALEFMPLAIVQAASYIRNRASRYSVSQYLRDFQRSDREATKLLKKEAGHPYRDWEAKNTILVTWQMSFDYLRQTKPSATELLSLMSFFDRQGIPENLIRRQPKANYISSSEFISDFSDGETSESDLRSDFEDDITTLRDYSFISVSENSTSFTMHRLVQLTTRAWLGHHGRIDQWKDKFISTLCDEFPTGKFENWGKCRPLFPHVKSAMSQRPASPQCLEQWATLLYRGAWYASQSGNIVDIREMAAKSREQRRVLFDDNHKDVLDSTVMLATAYWLEGQWEKAEQLNVQVMKTRKTKLGEDHPDTLTSMANLASTYRNQGRWEKAERLGVQVMKSSKTKLGEDHPDTLTSMAELAFTWKASGHPAEAINLLRDCLTKQKQTLGLKHPTTLSNIEEFLEWKTERLNTHAGMG